MRYSIKTLLLTLFLLPCQAAFSTNLITFFIRPYPEIPSTEPFVKAQVRLRTSADTQKLIDQIQTPGKISKKVLKNTLLKPATTDGIFSTYWGYLALSNLNGQVTFPRKQAKEAVKLLITEKINPIMMLGATVHHWNLDHSVPAQLFSIEKKQDPETKLYYWNTQEIDLPKNNIIQLDTIVLFAKPNHMYVPTGITLSDKNPQLFLPDIYAKKTLNVIARALWVLTVKHFFGSMKRVLKKESDVYYSQFLYVK